MEARHQRLIQRRGWDRACEHYGRYWQRQLRPAHDLLLERARLTPGEHVVDVACGSGELTMRIAAAVAPGTVTATDLSPKMIAATRELAEVAARGNVDAVCCDAEQLGELDTLGALGSYDAALCSLGLMYVPDPATAIAELRRTVRPGGRVAVSVWGDRRNCGWAGVFPIVDSRVVSDVCPRFFALGADGMLAGLLEACGFVDVEDTRLQVALGYADGTEALGAAFLGGPVALAYGRFDGDTRRQVGDEYLASIARFALPDGSYCVPGEFVVATGRRPG